MAADPGGFEYQQFIANLIWNTYSTDMCNTSYESCEHVLWYDIYIGPVCLICIMLICIFLANLSKFLLFSHITIVLISYLLYQCSM
jgi:hypothetical protein